MSSIPGCKLEEFLAWNYNFLVEGQADPNPSMQAAAAAGVFCPRTCLTKEQFAPLVALAEPYRAAVEGMLEDFNEAAHSWRDYAPCVSLCIPAEATTKMEELANWLNSNIQAKQGLDAETPSVQARVRQTDFFKVEDLKFNVVDLMEAGELVRSAGFLQGTSNWAANLMAYLKDASYKHQHEER